MITFYKTVIPDTGVLVPPIDVLDPTTWHVNQLVRNLGFRICGQAQFKRVQPLARACAVFGWHYLSNATCLIRPHALYVFVVVSRTTIICHLICHF